MCPVGETTGMRTLGDLAVMRRRAAQGGLRPAEVDVLFAELQRLRSAESSAEERRCKLHHILGALAEHFASRPVHHTP
jgi:hypothetical protein